MWVLRTQRCAVQGGLANGSLVQKRFVSWAPKKPAQSSFPRRTGVIAMKAGMIPAWDKWGVRHSLTVLAIENVQVTQVKTKKEDVVDALVVGSGLAKPSRLSWSQKGQFAKYDLPYKRHLAQFSVSPENFLPVGTRITAKHFVPGQYVDVQGTTIGKGFAGGMKRHGFKGQGASHGNSKAHRIVGGMGGSQDPGRIFKGKKMPGRMGNTKMTVQNLLVYQIDASRDLVFVKGHVPGKRGSMVRIRDAKKKPHVEGIELPFPTDLSTEEELLAEKERAETTGERYLVMEAPSQNPLETLT
mmetsp:Transcript_20836/g.25240  ORF Transcript_20836/g.25240 Transcript_20836/m.25240 type:complete len:299 (-) Transcript_20836:1321-2217(-)|eukprot:CAMPEP_0204869016 /NCGR_PEP_ID=MMETSP1348-20121228/28337_1 /ASSEMBLY_ACC=CAM_ASM_000700 /TAXON_ID=215587 /ORGANISM="Aplanochytrium stocchinoi, Strain GSBS06" /LENGTH=298 /DNA_ID=CAMNT_0052022181 /DNA_START=132 /DNA_END=1028 /DNA_ORIENTATION=+